MCCSRSPCAPSWTCEKHYADQGGLNAVVIKLRLPDGTMYDQTGKIDYVEPTRARRPPTRSCCAAGSPIRRCRPVEPGQPVDRALIDGEFVTVLVEGIQPVTALGIPRAAVLSDQQGDYVYVVGRAEQGAAAPHPARPVHAHDRRGHRPA